MTPAAMTNRLGEVRALFSTTRSTAPHERIVDYVADRMLLEVQGLAKTMLPALRATIYDLPSPQRLHADDYRGSRGVRDVRVRVERRNCPHSQTRYLYRGPA